MSALASGSSAGGRRSESPPIPIIVNGITGRMGRRVAELAAADPSGDFSVLAGIAGRRPASGWGTIAGVPVVDTFEAAVALAAGGRGARAVVIDFSAPDCVAALARSAVDAGVALVSGTTGLAGPQPAALRSAAERIAVVWAPNMSLGVHLLGKLVALAAETLGPAAEVEIIETHHRHKADAPSGTAKKLAEIVRQARRGPGEGEAAIRTGRSGNTPGGRPRGEIGIHSLRMGEVTGDHEVFFALDHEIVSVGHRALSRDVFVTGALAAARFASTAAPGLYGMDQVIGFHG